MIVKHKPGKANNYQIKIGSALPSMLVLLASLVILAASACSRP